MTSNTAVRFALVGLLGWIVDLALFQALWRAGLGLSVAHVSSFFAAAATNFVLNSRWAFQATSGGRLDWLGFARFLTVSLLALFLRGGVLVAGHERLGLSPTAALCAAIVTAALINYLGCVFYVFPRPSGRTRAVRWRTAAIGVIGYALLLRLVYLGLPDLTPQEAYYWNYAQHPALSYLDHPPMVAWLIAMGTALFGDTELGVRVGAYACWLVTAGFLFRFARNLYDKATALKAVMLAAALPFFLVSGFVTTPDAPLVACWAGALFFLERALLAEKRLAWWGVGACLGLGMLSKYTIVLLAVAALAFLLLDRRSRRWLARPEPYAATLLASLLLLPVIVWNVHNGWASFAFQSTSRMTEPPSLGLHRPHRIDPGAAHTRGRDRRVRGHRPAPRSAARSLRREHRRRPAAPLRDRPDARAVGGLRAVQPAARAEAELDGPPLAGGAPRYRPATAGGRAPDRMGPGRSRSTRVDTGSRRDAPALRRPFALRDDRPSGCSLFGPGIAADRVGRARPRREGDRRRPGRAAHGSGRPGDPGRRHGQVLSGQRPGLLPSRWRRRQRAHRQPPPVRPQRPDVRRLVPRRATAWTDSVAGESRPARLGRRAPGNVGGASRPDPDPRDREARPARAAVSFPSRRELPAAGEREGEPTAHATASSGRRNRLLATAVLLTLGLAMTAKDFGSWCIE